MNVSTTIRELIPLNLTNISRTNIWNRIIYYSKYKSQRLDIKSKEKYIFFLKKVKKSTKKKMRVTIKKLLFCQIKYETNKYND